MIRTLALLASLLLAAGAAHAQTSKTYKNARGKDVVFPAGDLSFADEVVTLTPGKPAPKASASDAKAALGPPDYAAPKDANYVTLGCGGSAVYRFTDNALAEIDGPDLYVFEIGPAVEATELSISADGKTWIKVGKIAGATAAVDISKVATKDQTFSYVQLTDLKAACGGATPGADIDAVGAIGAGRRVVLDAAVLFDVDKAVLKKDATAALAKLAAEIKAMPKARVVVEGHTDSSGADAYNLDLSKRRADSVRAFLGANGVAKEAISSVGYGEAQPTAPNDSEAGKAKNRRVELVIIPG